MPLSNFLGVVFSSFSILFIFQILHFPPPHFCPSFSRPIILVNLINISQQIYVLQWNGLTKVDGSKILIRFFKFSNFRTWSERNKPYLGSGYIMLYWQDVVKAHTYGDLSKVVYSEAPTMKLNEKLWIRTCEDIVTNQQDEFCLWFSIIINNYYQLLSMIDLLIDWSIIKGIR